MSRPRRRTAAAALFALLAGVLLVARPGPADAEVSVVEFDFTGAPETWTVPDEITEITATTCGAQGGASVTSAHEVPGPSEGGANGGCATATLPVTPGEELTIRVGGQPIAEITTSLSPLGGTYSTPGGYNGGAPGGADIRGGTADEPVACLEAMAIAGAAGGGGGGASDIRQDGDALGDRVLVGGGGGGAAAATIDDSVVDDDPCIVPSPPGPGAATEGSTSTTSTTAGGAGGAGGGAQGDNGGFGADDTDGATGGIGGTGGTQLAGGTGINDGSSGEGGAGGDRGGIDAVETPVLVEMRASVSAGGGGGGGWFGGGGGDAGQLLGAPNVGGGGGGGGGSGFGPAGVTYEVGAQAGNGSVTITFGGPDVDPDPTDPDPPTQPPVIAGRPTFTG